MLSGFSFVRRLPTRHAGLVWQTDLPAGKSARGAPPLRGDVALCVQPQPSRGPWYSHGLRGRDSGSCDTYCGLMSGTGGCILAHCSSCRGGYCTLIQWWCQA